MGVHDSLTLYVAFVYVSFIGIVLLEMEYKYELMNNGTLSDIKLKLFLLNHIFTNFIIVKFMQKEII